MPSETKTVPHALADLPGFLIRRLHQIHVALFAEECGLQNVTPVQYSILTVAAAQPGLDQAALGYEVGVDRATLANVLGRLEARGLLRRAQGRRDMELPHVAGAIDHIALDRPAARRRQRQV